MPNEIMKIELLIKEIIKSLKNNDRHTKYLRSYKINVTKYRNFLKDCKKIADKVKKLKLNE